MAWLEMSGFVVNCENIPVEGLDWLLLKKQCIKVEYLNIDPFRGSATDKDISSFIDAMTYFPFAILLHPGVRLFYIFIASLLLDSGAFYTFLLLLPGGIFWHVKNGINLIKKSFYLIKNNKKFQ